VFVLGVQAPTRAAAAMSDFRQVVCAVFNRIGMGTPPASYVDDVVALNRAAAEWHAQPNAGGYGFLEFDLPDLLDAGTIQTGNLPDAIAIGWAKNAAAKAFVLFIDERTNYRATLLMLQIVLLIQQLAQQSRVNSTGGSG
jgi:hypothetical protein